MLVAFHTSDSQTRPGQAMRVTEWWGEQVDLDFRFLDPVVETVSLRDAGFHLEARLDRTSIGSEHPSERTYLLVRK